LNIPPDRIFAAHCVFQISIVSLVLNIINVPFQALLKAHEEFSKIAVLDVLRAVLKLGVLFLLYRIQYDKLVALSLMNFAVTIIYISIIVLYAKKYSEAKFKLLRDKVLVKKMLSFISMLIFTVLASVFNKQGIVIIVNLFFGLSINAAYAVAFQVSQMLDTFAMNFKQAVVPQLMQSFGANDMSRMNKLIFLGTKVTFLLMMLISIPVLFEADYILKIWLKEPPEHASVFTMFIVIGVNINTFYYFIYQAVHASGRIKKQQILTSISYLVSVGVIYLAFKMGANFYYAAIIPILFSVVRNIIVIISAVETINFKVKHYFSNVILPCAGIVLALIITPLALTYFIDTSLLRLIIVLTSNTLLLAVLGYFMVLNKEERAILSGLLFKNK
jgi:O-antigen/teichoic acid export membrane protein